MLGMTLNRCRRKRKMSTRMSVSQMQSLSNELSGANPCGENFQGRYTSSHLRWNPKMAFDIFQKDSFVLEGAFHLILVEIN